jgi:hypothetical protein
MSTAAPGGFLTAALWNSQVRDLGNFMLGVPVFSGYQNTGQSFASGSPGVGPVAIDTEVLDPAGGHSNTVNPSRYTPQAPGTYFVAGTVGWTAVSAATPAYRRAWIRLNGNTIRGAVGSIDQQSNVQCAVSASGFVTCNGTTDYIELYAAQSTGSALSTTTGAADFASSLSVFWISS